MAIVLVELKPGIASVCLRREQNTVQILEGWEDLPLLEAIQIAFDIIDGKQEIAGKKCREIMLPADYWEKMEKK